MAKTSAVKKHLRLLLILTITTRLLILLLVYLASYLPLFDASPQLVFDGTESPWTSTLLRWDAFHFAHIAEKGYVYEHEWAFFPGTPFVMRAAGHLLNILKQPGKSPKWISLLQGGALAAMACDTTHTLYLLTLKLLGSPSIALIASILSLLPSSPATLHLASYSEPFSTYLSYKGMLCCAKSQWALAAVLFALAGTFRSNGFLLSGFILWGLIIQPVLCGKKVTFFTYSEAIILTSIVFFPFVTYQYFAYETFCVVPVVKPSWCSNFPPLIYTHVQATYWNVGFLRYWTIQQLPNFVISAPVILCLLQFSIYHIIYGFMPLLVRSDWTSGARTPTTASLYLSESITPHALHALFLTCTLLFASHIQIVLRLAASMPFTYWAGAWLVTERPRWGHMWVAWSVVWGTVSIILWIAFLPPA